MLFPLVAVLACAAACNTAGPIPTELANLSALNNLDLGGNKLSGEFHTSLFRVAATFIMCMMPRPAIRLLLFELCFNTLYFDRRRDGASVFAREDAVIGHSVGVSSGQGAMA